MSTRWSTGVFLICALACCGAEAEEPQTVYLQDLRAPDLGDPNYLRQIKEFAPGLLILGRSVPFDSSLGPIAQLGGGDSDARDLRDRSRIAPKELDERMKFLSRFNTVLQELGVRVVVPYTSALSLIGDEKNPSGFFDFHNHWTDYRRLGPRPNTTPIRWIACDEQGKPIPLGKELEPSHLAPMKRYAACPSNPAWRSWMKHVVSTCSDCGYDGVFVDHCLVKKCHCASCRAAFRAFIASRYDAAGLMTYFEKREIEAVDLADDNMTLAGAETALYRWSILRDLLREMKTAATNRTTCLLVKGLDLEQTDYFAPEADLFLFDAAERRPLFCTPGVVETPIVNGIYKRKCLTNIVPYKCVAGLSQKRPMAVLSPTPDPYIRRLGFAEALAFGSPPIFGGSAPFVDAESRSEYAQFLKKNADILQDTAPCADVAVAFFGKQACYPKGDQHLTQAYRAIDTLARHHVAFEVATESAFNPNLLSRYRVIIIPALLHVNDALLLTIRKYVEDGGTLVVSGDSFRCDERCERRANTLLDETIHRDRATQAAILHIAVGKGWIVHTPGEMDEEALAQGIRQGLEGPLQLIYRGAPFVRTNTRLKDKQDSADILVHLVNYNVCPSRQGDKVAPARSLLTFVRTPRQWSVFSVTAHSPDAPVSTHIEFSHDQRSSVLTFTVPEVKIYTVIQVSCRTRT